MPHSTLQQTEEHLALAKMLSSRMERLSADSSYARQASGARGSLLKLIDELEALSQDQGISPEGRQQVLARLQFVMHFCFRLLEKAAIDLTK